MNEYKLEKAFEKVKGFAEENFDGCPQEHIKELIEWDDEYVEENIDDNSYSLSEHLELSDYQTIVEMLSGNYYHLWDKDFNYFGFSTSEYSKYQLKDNEINGK